MTRKILPALMIPLMLVLLSSIAEAAVVHGSIYDLSLDLQKDVVVEAGSSPKQTMVSKDGSYSFELPDGNYVITAKLLDGGEVIASAQQEVEVKGEGSYVVDLILVESLDEDEALLDTPDIEVDTSVVEQQASYWPYAATALIIIALSAAAFFWLRKRKQKPVQQSIAASQDPYIGKMLAFIRKEGGRASQKDIRKALGLSEAKISLMVVQLEHEGKVKKIKRGRGNIIVLAS